MGFPIPLRWHLYIESGRAVLPATTKLASWKLSVSSDASRLCPCTNSGPSVSITMTRKLYTFSAKNLLRYQTITWTNSDVLDHRKQTSVNFVRGASTPFKNIFKSVVCTITVTPWWARWRLKSSAFPLFAQVFVQAQIKGNIKAPRHWPL